LGTRVRVGLRVSRSRIDNEKQKLQKLKNTKHKHFSMIVEVLASLVRRYVYFSVRGGEGVGVKVNSLPFFNFEAFLKKRK